MALSHYKILLLAKSINEENKELINAMKDAFAKYPEYEVVAGTVSDFFPGIIWNIFNGIAGIIVGILPGLYKSLYNWSNHSKVSLHFRNLLCNILAMTAGDYFRQASPDGIIALDPLAAGIIDNYKKLHAKTFFGTIVPEYSVHSWWMFERTNAYFFANDDLQPHHGLLQPWQKIYTYGIPIAKSFREDYRREYLRMKYGWKKNDRLCMIINWGNNALPIDDLVTSIINNYDPTMKFMALIGKNLNMMRTLRKLPYSIKIFGYLDSPAEMINCADYLVSSAQGVLAASVMTTPAKYVVYEPAPGQETANAEYLQELGAAKIALNPFDVANLIKEYDRDANIFLGAMGKPLAADYIAEAIIQGID